MGIDVAKDVEVVLSPSAIKVHRLMCAELMKMLDRISKIFPDIEAARPRCSSGLQALCLLNRAIEKAKLLIQYCSESSKLYLAITGDVIMARCERSRKLLQQSLSQIENMVPMSLAVEISDILNDLRTTTFIFDPLEEETGKVVRALVLPSAPQSTSIENSEIQALQFAAPRLHITTPKALLIEKRSVKKLLDIVSDKDPTKKKILTYLLHLLVKYGKFMIGEQIKNIDTAQKESITPFPLSKLSNDPQRTEILSGPTPVPPQEFKCTLSMKLMYDPVVIASGETYERIWIQKWFDEGHDTCPNTRMKLAHFSVTPNTVMKDLISKWCTDHRFTMPDSCERPDLNLSLETSSNSIVSFGTSMNDLYLPMDLSNAQLEFSDYSYISSSSRVSSVSIQTNEDSQTYPSNTEKDDVNLKLLSFLYLLPWESQKKAVEDVKSYLYHNDEAFDNATSENFVEPLMRFLQEARDRVDLKCQKVGFQLLLEFVNKNRNEVPCFIEDMSSILEHLLESDITGEVLAILSVLSDDNYFRSKIAESGILTSILKNFDTQIRENQEFTIKILYNLSSNNETCSKIVFTKFIPKLVPFLSDDAFAKFVIVILKRLCENEEARVCIAETSGCISAIVEILDNESVDEQEHAVAVLLSLCVHHVKYCRLVMDEGVIPALCKVSINGNDQGKVIATELLKILGDIKFNEIPKNFLPKTEDHKEPGIPSKVYQSNSKKFFGIFTKKKLTSCCSSTS